MVNDNSNKEENKVEILNKEIEKEVANKEKKSKNGDKNSK